MNIIDIIAVIPLLYFAAMGYKKGILKEVFGLLAMLAGIIMALKASHYVLSHLSTKTQIESPLLPLVVYCLLFLSAFIVVLLIGRLFENIIKAAQLNITNHLLGMLLGIVKAFLIVSLFIWLIDTAALFDDVAKSQSYCYKYVKDVTPVLIDNLGEIIPWFKDLISNIESYFSDIAQRIDTAH